MLFLVYWLLACAVALGLIRRLWRSRDWREQVLAAMVLVPLALRALLVK